MKAIVKLQVNINKHRPLGGSQYKTKKAVINVKKKRFKWTILSALHHDEVDPKNTDRVTQYHRWQEELNLKTMEFPVSLKGIGKFEKANSTLAVNVFGINDNEVYPLRISDVGKQRERDINLLLIMGDGRKYVLAGVGILLLHQVI